MPPADTPRPETLAARFADEPFLRDLATPLDIPPAGSIEETIRRLSQVVRWKRPPAVVRLTIAEPDYTRSCILQLSRESCTVGESRQEDPDLEILTTAEVWRTMLGGELAPLQAFGEGRMRVRGSLEIARALVRGLREA